MAADLEKTELSIDDGGIWAVRSTSSTVCYLDLDRLLLLRDRGLGSQAFPLDGDWVPLVRIASQRGDFGIVRVGDRHEYLTEPGGIVSDDDYRYWVPRVCLAIEQVVPTSVPGATGRTKTVDGVSESRT